MSSANTSTSEGATAGHATGVQIPHSATEVEAAYRCVSRRIMPVMFVAYVVSYMDAYNIGFAQLQMKDHIGLTDAMYGIGAGLLVLGQTLFILPSNLFLHRFGARATILRVMLCWGLGSAALAFVDSPAAFILLRFVTGILTAGLWAGLLLYLTYWFPSGRRARMISVLMLSPVVGGIIVGPLSGWIIGTLHDYGGLMGWQWMFILEAIPCFAVAAIVYPLLSDRPEHAAWLSPLHRGIVEHNLAEDQRATRSEQLVSLRAVFGNARVYLLGLAGALITFGMVGTAVFMPMIIRDMGVASVQMIGLLSAIPYLVGGITMVLYSRHSDRTLERRWHVAIALATATGGFAILAAGGGVGTGILGLTLVVAGLLSAPPCFWPIPSAFMSGTGAAAGIGLILVICEIGGALAPAVLGHIRTGTGSLDVALAAIAVLLVVGAAVILLTVPRTLLRERRPD